MVKATASQPNAKGYFAVIIVVALIAVGFAYLYMQKSSAYTQETGLYNNLNSNYSTFKTQTQSQISTLQGSLTNVQNQLAENKTLLSNVSKKYNTTEYNLTHPYTQIILNNQVETIKPETLNTTDNTWYAPSYNMSFNATYPGYLIINFSAAPNNNNLKNSTLDIYVTQRKPYIQGGVPIVNDFLGYYSAYAGPNGSVKIPVSPGTNYIDISNFYGQTVPVQLTITYVGYHTS